MDSIALLGIFSVGAILKFHLPAWQWDPRKFHEIPFLAQFFAAASYQLSWSIYMSDYSRYLPRDVGVWPSFWWTYLGPFPGGASLTLLSVADSIKPIDCTVANRLKSLCIVAVLAIVIAPESSGDFSNRFNDLLAVLRYLFTPLTAINLVDFYWVRKGHYSIREIFNPRRIYGRWNWHGLVAYCHDDGPSGCRRCLCPSMSLVRSRD